MFIKCFLIVCGILSGAVFEARAGVKVVDGDSLELNGKRIRLVGIDAPELFQTCHDAAGKKYDCGKKSQAFLKSLILNAQQKKQKIHCRSEGKDIYNRNLSVCYAGKLNLNLEMIKNGWAVCYRSETYAKTEQTVRQKKVGIWQGKFMRPEIFRAIKRATEKSQKR